MFVLNDRKTKSIIQNEFQMQSLLFLNFREHLKLPIDWQVIIFSPNDFHLKP